MRERTVKRGETERERGGEETEKDVYRARLYVVVSRITSRTRE